MPRGRRVIRLIKSAARTDQVHLSEHALDNIAAGDLAQLLDVRAETVSRWENDKRPIDRGSYAVLHQLILDRLHHSTATADYLRSLQHPRKLPQRVKLESRAA